MCQFKNLVQLLRLSVVLCSLPCKMPTGSQNIAIDKIRSKEFRNSSKTEDIENNVLIVDKQINSKINPEIIGLKDLIGKLKPEHKIILDLVYFEGFTHVEVAEKLEIPLGTVKTRLRNAIITFFFNFDKSII